MKKIALFSICLISSLLSFGQKVDLDKFSFPYSVISLPSQYIEPEKRTYGVSLKIASDFDGSVNQESLYNGISIGGFRKIEDKPTVGVRLFINSYEIKDVAFKTRAYEEKDKDGKVIKTTYKYYSTAKFDFGGSYHFVEQMTLEEQEKAKKEAIEKAKKEAEVKKEAMAKAASTNRFLQTVQTTETKPQDTTDVNFQSERIIKYYYPGADVYVSDEVLTEKQASEAFYAIKEKIKQQNLVAFIGGFRNGVNQELAARYGFNAIKGSDILWILDSKKHPEYATQQEAINAVKVLMATMSAHASIDDLSKNMQPLLDYFASLKTKYTSDEKADKKMRYSAYYNLAKIYQYLDQHDKAIEQANELIKNDFDPKDGEALIKVSEGLKARLANQKMTTRHKQL